MLKIEKTVFISYRRTNIGFALAIHQNLTHRGYDVFFDYESIGAGDFEQIILRSIESRAHFVAILTPSALERCNEPGDWLRREIEHAIRHQRNIIPLTFEGFDFKDMARYLPDHIATPLSRYNGLRVPTDYFNEAMGKLSERLNIPLDAVLHPPSVAVQNEEARQQVVIAAKPTVSERTLTASEYFERAYQHGEAGRYDAEIADYSEAIRLKPDDALAYYNRGIAKKNKGDHSAAIADYDQAIRLKPDYAFAYLNRGAAKAHKRDYDGAIADFNQAIRLKPDDAEAYYSRGLAKDYKGDHDGAIADYNKAIRLKPDHADTYAGRGAVKYNKGDYNGAIVDYEQAIRLKPDYALAYLNRGAAKKSKGDHDGAIADYNKALRLKPDFAEAYYNRGVAKKNKGDYRGAIVDYQKYLDLGGGERDGDQAEVEQIISDLRKLL